MKMFAQTFLLKNLNVKVFVEWSEVNSRKASLPRVLGISDGEILFDKKIGAELVSHINEFDLNFKIMGKWKQYSLRLSAALPQTTQNSMPFELVGHKMSELRRDLLMSRRRE